MNKRHNYLAVGFFVVFAIQGIAGFREIDPTISFEAFVERERQKYPEITEENINAVIDHGKKNGNFPTIDRKEIVFFFHAAKFNVKKACDIIVKHYEIRKLLPEIFTKDEEDPEITELEEAKNVMSYSILHNEKYEPPGMHYIYTHFIDKNPDNFDFIKNVRYFFYMIKCLLRKYGTFDGVIVVMNAEGFTFHHLLKLKSHQHLFSPFSSLIHGALPLRLTKIYVLNASKTAKMAHSFFSLFRNKKEESSVTLYSPKNKKVFEEVSKTIMPEDGYLNGEGPSYIDQAEKTYALMKKIHQEDNPVTEN
ncbi:uncharacterized protein LOC126845187 isoform X1 [Adelges cooleyi]|uniref:uncharacterized protein LOC126845187 isoform X1 n=1 Tax=Adelges cooleyi TaxID=133065 RepID=UPI0021807C22|nr:uncharacterized protein LOC126845187 isoform X1 [Adelges cooleyi]